MAHRLAQQAEIELGELWYYIARESGSAEIADRVIDTITERFYLLAVHPELGRRRDHDLGPGLRSFSVGAFIILYRAEADDVAILHVARGSRDLPALIGRFESSA